MLLVIFKATTLILFCKKRNITEHLF